MRIHLLLWFIGLTQGLLAQQESTLPEYFISLIQDQELANASMAFTVFDLEADTIIFEYFPNLSLPPASLQKVITTAAAIEVLGPDFKHFTILGYHGQLQVNGLLDGDIVIKGGGDPTLGSRYFNSTINDVVGQWVDAIAGQNIREISGNVVGDASYAGKLGVGESWPYVDLGNYYACGSYGLNMHDNLYTITFQQNPIPGKPVKLIRTFPQVEGLEVINKVVSGPRGSGDQAYIFGGPFQFNRFIKGTIPPGNDQFSIKGSLPDPPLFAAQALKAELTKNKLPVHGIAESRFEMYNGEIYVLDTLYAPPLIEIVNITKRESVNFLAEAIGRTLVKSVTPSMEITGNLLRSIWESRQVSMEGCRFTDYCGLAPDNAVTANAMVRVLRYIYQKKDLFKHMHASMSVGGVNGTMKYLFRSSPSKGKIVGKSGLINGVRNYAGYMHLPDDRTLAFCVLSYNFSCSQQDMRKKLEQFLDSLYLSYSK